MVSLRFLLAAACVLTVLAAHPAAALTTDRNGYANADGSSKFSDPDDQLDNLAGGNSASASGNPGMLKFGDPNGPQTSFGFQGYSGSGDRTRSAIN